METIITLLLLLLPVIFKLIGKKFEKNGQAGRAEKMRELAKMFGTDDDDLEVRHDDDGHVVEVLPVERIPVVTENVVRQTPLKKTPVIKTPVVKKPILEEDVQTRKGEKIDPKKLVIYSEIMKPKYTE